MTNSQSESEKNKLVTVFKVIRSGDQARLAIAQSILNSANIFNCTKNDTVQNLFGWGALSGFNPFTGPIELQVESDRLEEAIELLSGLSDDVDSDDEIDDGDSDIDGEDEINDDADYDSGEP
jgi:hypothetical protein